MIIVKYTSERANLINIIYNNDIIMYLVISKRNLLTSINIIDTLTVPDSSAHVKIFRGVSQGYTVIDE